MLGPLLAAVLSAAASACPPRALEVPAVGFNLVEEVEGSGFGSGAAMTAVDRIATLGASAIAVVVPVRLPDLQSNAFYTYAPPTREVLVRLVGRAHERGLRVVIVPHIWVDGGAWRGDITRQGAAADAFFESYLGTVGAIADDAEAACADALSLGVELKGLTTAPGHAPRFDHLRRELRQRFGGLLTYSANWDEAERVTFWRELDLISVNGFYPLTSSEHHTDADLRRGAERAVAALDSLAERHQRPLLILEVGYKACADNARRPWEWPAGPSRTVDEAAQERSYRAFTRAVRGAPRIVGVLFWLVPTGTDSPGAPPFEPAWGFSPLGKRAEVVVRETAAWAAARRRVGRVVTPPGPQAPQRRP